MAYINQAWSWQGLPEPTDLVLSQSETTEPREGQVLIENQIIALNPVDWKLLAGGPDLWHKGVTPGVDGMGVVVAVGKNVQHLRVGSRVAYHTNLRQHGSFAHYTLVSAKALIAVPDHVSNESAAALPCPGLTAWQAMKKVPDLKGKKVLVTGAGGSVGYILTQLLIKEGAYVYCTASAARHEQLLKLGVIKVMDYRDENWPTALTSHSLDAIFDTVSGKHAASIAHLLGYYGHLVCIQDRVETSPLPPFSHSISLHEIALGAIHQYGTDKQWYELVCAGQALLDAVGRKELLLPPQLVWSFSQLPLALTQLKAMKDGTKHLINVQVK